jgi:hypothetical protein
MREDDYGAFSDQNQRNSGPFSFVRNFPTPMIHRWMVDALMDTARTHSTESVVHAAGPPWMGDAVASGSFIKPVRPRRAENSVASS